jgi:hypothetical protein
MADTRRGQALTVCAVLFGMLAVSNFLKTVRLTSDTGFVFFGHRLTGTPNAVAGVAFGVFLLIYASGIWRLKRYALTMGYAYAAYVVLNLVLFNFYGPKPPDAGVGYAIFGLVYAAIAIGVSSGAVYLLKQREAMLR